MRRDHMAAHRRHDISDKVWANISGPTPNQVHEEIPHGAISNKRTVPRKGNGSRDISVVSFVRYQLGA